MREALKALTEQATALPWLTPWGAEPNSLYGPNGEFICHSKYSALIAIAVNHFGELVAMIEQFQRSRSVGDFENSDEDAEVLLAKIEAAAKETP